MAEKTRKTKNTDLKKLKPLTTRLLTSDTSNHIKTDDDIPKSTCVYIFGVPIPTPNGNLYSFKTTKDCNMTGTCTFDCNPACITAVEPGNLTSIILSCDTVLEEEHEIDFESTYECHGKMADPTTDGGTGNINSLIAADRILLELIAACEGTGEPK